jgi:hypothetical protein
MTDGELKQELIALISQGKKLLFRIEKFTSALLEQDLGVKRVFSSKTKKKAKNVIEFNAEGEVIRDKL